jgi:hypothetical protein
MPDWLITLGDQLGRAALVAVSGWNVTSTLALLGIVGAAVSFWRGLTVYREERLRISAEQKRQASLQVIARLDAMMANPKVRTALMTLDWTSREIVLDDQSAALVGARTLRFDKEMVKRALAADFTEVNNGALVYLRDCYDELLDDFLVLDSMISNNVATDDVVTPFIGYYADVMAGENKEFNERNSDLLEAINAFVEKYYDEEKIDIFVQRISKLY